MTRTLISSLILLCVAQGTQDYNIRRRNIVGKAEYCTLGKEVICFDHTLAQCLRSAYLTPDVYECIEKDELVQKIIKDMFVNYIGI